MTIHKKEIKGITHYYYILDGLHVPVTSQDIERMSK